jgi:hypothetical protein
VRALERPLVVAPHLQHDLDGLLEPFESLGHRRVRHAEGMMLAVVPGGADAEERPSLAQHVEGRRDLGQKSGVPVGHARDDRSQLHPLGFRGEIAERRVALEHRVVCGLEALHLEEVVHDREPGCSPGFRGRRGLRDGRCQCLGIAGQREIEEVESEAHTATLRAVGGH